MELWYAVVVSFDVAIGVWAWDSNRFLSGVSFGFATLITLVSFGGV